MTNAQTNSPNFAVIRSFKKMFHFVTCMDTAVECTKMFDYCEVSDVTDLAVLSVWHVTSIWLETCPCLAAYVVHCLFHFVACVSLCACL